MSDDEQPTNKHIDLGKPMQQHVLASVLRVPGLMAKLRPILDPDFFKDTVCSDMIAWSRNFWDEYKTVPSKQALKDTFRDDGELIKFLYKQDVEDVKHTEKRIIEFAQASAAANALMKGGDMLKAHLEGKPYRNEETNRVEFEVVTAQDLVDIISKAAMVGKNLGEMGDDYHATLEANLKELICPTEAEVMGTGIGHLDQAGILLERGEMGCVLGPSKRGKSHVLINIAFNAMIAGKNVVYYSLEMKNRRVFNRFYARLAGNKQDMKQDPVRFAEAVRLKTEKFVKGRMVMKRYAAHTATISDIRAHYEALKSTGFKADVIVIDYAGLMRPCKESKEVRHNLESVFLDIRQFAAEEDVFMWTGAQANRAATSKEIVTAADFAECYAIMQHIDVGFSICISDAEKAARKGRFFILGSRNEQDGSIVEFTFDYSRSRFITERITLPVEEKRARDKSSTSAGEKDEAAFQKALARKKKEERDGASA